MNINSVLIVGRATEKPELRTTNGGQPVARLGIATNRVWTDKQGEKQEQVEFHNCILFGKTAEIANSYIEKGAIVGVRGRLQTRGWTDKEGVERKSTEIIVEDLQLGPRSENKPAPRAAASKKADPRPALDEDDTDREMQELFGKQ
jgi:single-strand DNA-binding protein